MGSIKKGPKEVSKMEGGNGKCGRSGGLKFKNFGNPERKVTLS